MSSVLTLPHAAEFGKAISLIQQDAHAAQAWNHTKEFADASLIDCDRALAYRAIRAGWADPEVVELLKAHRRHWKRDPDVGNGYYARIIQDARAQEARTRVADHSEAVAALRDTDPEAARQAARASLSDLLGVAVTRMVKYTSDPPQYRLETPHGAITLGGVEAMVEQSAFRARVAAVAGTIIPKFKAKTWDAVAQLLLDACEEESLGLEATDAGWAEAWLTDYLSERRPFTEDDWPQAAQAGYPFEKGGYVYISPSRFRDWLRLLKGERVDFKFLGRALRAYGCEQVRLSARVDGYPQAFRLWRIPI